MEIRLDNVDNISEPYAILCFVLSLIVVVFILKCMLQRFPYSFCVSNGVNLVHLECICTSLLYNKT